MLDSGHRKAALGHGVYSIAEASRLLHAQPRSVSRWLNGYNYRSGGLVRRSGPLWSSSYSFEGSSVELSFDDLVELRFVRAFFAAGLALPVIRRCHDMARELLGVDRPFLSGKFLTDGETIFHDETSVARDAALLDLKRNQFVFREVVRHQFKDLDLKGGQVARWRPFNGKPTIVIDPTRSFGRPITTESGVPTEALAVAVHAEGSLKIVARQFDLTEGIVRDAVRFQEALEAA